MIARRDAKGEFAPGRSRNDYSFVFEVDRLYKGDVPAEVAVTTARDGARCGYEFREGEEYLVYAHGGQELETSICTRTVPIRKADADLNELGAPTTIFRPGRKDSWNTPIAAALIAFLAGFMAGRIRFPRRVPASPAGEAVA